ncbi:hypothetical protein OWR29_47825 [Actinoplanes sp. Pm04-4]|uniref:Uncharacterized protein n=1 Tax=Paractinoplanes pyxinae TaxID=2997416 RepID=A0ABT4BH16_9ACTN|nr:hypothetical protein [Actinoplanes pyxinae]MCY1145756.1 hypothetical protein [Actinoplanes pyxinae]
MLLRHIVATDAAIVVVASVSGSLPGISGSLQELVGRARSLLVLGTPISDEFSVAVIAAGHGAAVCARTGQQPQLVVSERLPAVAEITRALLSHLP